MKRQKTPAEKAIEDAIEVVSTACADLAGYYLDLGDHTARQSIPSAPGGAKPPGQVVAPLPISVHVVDLIAQVEHDVDHLENLIRRRFFDLPPAMRHGRRDRAGLTTSTPPPADPRITDALRWLEDTAPTIVAKRANALVTSTLWPLVGKSRRVLGLSELSYPLEAPCPYCDAPESLRALPDRGIVFCCNPDCIDPPTGKPYRSVVTRHLLVWSAS